MRLSCSHLVLLYTRPKEMARGAICNARYDIRINPCYGARRIYGLTRMALSLNEGAARVAVHRLRKRYRELLHGEIAQTLTDSADADEELRAFFKAFAD